jgi:hypothetical protein
VNSYVAPHSFKLQKSSSKNFNDLNRFSRKLSSNSASETIVNPSTPPKKSPLWDAYLKITDQVTTLFPLWTVLFAGLAIVRPETFAWFTTKYFTLSLGKHLIYTLFYLSYQYQFIN